MHRFDTFTDLRVNSGDRQGEIRVVHRLGAARPTVDDLVPEFAHVGLEGLLELKPPVVPTEGDGLAAGVGARNDPSERFGAEGDVEGHGLDPWTSSRKSWT